MSAQREIITRSLTTSDALLVLSSEEKAAACQEALEESWEDSDEREQTAVNELIMEVHRLPWSSDRPAMTLYCHFMETLTFPDLCKMILQGPRYTADNALIATVLARFYFEYRNGKLFITKDEYYALLRAYLFDTCSLTELRKLILPRNFSLDDRYCFLKAIWQYRLGLAEASDIQDHARLWIRLTHLEHLLHYQQKDLQEVIHGLEYLVEQTEEFLTLWLCFNGEQPDTANKIKAVIGSKLQKYLDYDLSVAS